MMTGDDDVFVLILHRSSLLTFSWVGMCRECPDYQNRSTSSWSGDCSTLVFSLQLQLVTYDILGHCHAHLRLRLRQGRIVETFTRHSFYINLMIYFVVHTSRPIYFLKQRMKMRRKLRSLYLKPKPHSHP